MCASAQYALAAIAQGAPVRAFASVAGWFHDLPSVAPFYGGTEGVTLRLRRAREATELFPHTGQVRTVPAYDPGNDAAGMFLAMDYYGNPSRGAVPQWRNEMAELSWLPWLTFDGLAAAESVTVPSLFVHSDGCVFPDHIETLRKRLAGPVEVAWGEGAQTDFYDQPTQVDFAMSAVDAFFRGVLRDPGNPDRAPERRSSDVWSECLRRRHAAAARRGRPGLGHRPRGAGRPGDPGLHLAVGRRTAAALRRRGGSRPGSSWCRGSTPPST